MSDVQGYSQNYFAVKQRAYMNDPIKYAIHKQNVANYLKNRYHSEDEQIKNKFRNERKEINKRYYEKKKALLK